MNLGVGTQGGCWVDELLLVGPDNEQCLLLNEPVQRGELRRLVAEKAKGLQNLGVSAGDAVAMKLPPSIAFIVNMLATWKTGAQLIIVDHRVNPEFFDEILRLFTPRIAVTPATSDPKSQSGRNVAEHYAVHPGSATRTNYVLIQISSGSTGAPKAIGRSREELIAEIEKTASVVGMPGRGENLMLLTAFAYAYGLFAGLLHCLRGGACLIMPEVNARAILQMLDECEAPTSIFGVPFHARLLTMANAEQRKFPRLLRFVSSGENFDQSLRDMFSDTYGVPVGQLYGMTETGMIAADLDGQCFPGAGQLAPGVEARIEQEELCIRQASNPYVGRPDLHQWRDGWFHTGDAASLNAHNMVKLHGRLDSQVVIGGLKVDLLAVEKTVLSIEGVREAVVLHDSILRVYVSLYAPASTTQHLQDRLQSLLVPHQRPREVHVLAELPKTPSGKLIRDAKRLRAEAEAGT